jgi:adenylate kinase family enzyme
LILGAPCSGKTTIAKKISARFSVDHIEVDQLYWRRHKGGEVNSDFEKRLQQQISEKQSWVIEGRAGSVLPFIESEISHFLFLEPSWLQLIGRSLKRWVKSQNHTELVMNFNPRQFLKRRRIEQYLVAAGVSQLSAENALQDKYWSPR